MFPSSSSNLQVQYRLDRKQMRWISVRPVRDVKKRGFFKGSFNYHRKRIDSRVPAYTSHKHFYGVVSRIVDQVFHGFVLPKIDYDENLPTPTVVEDIDIEVQKWAKEAYELSVRAKTTKALIDDCEKRIKQEGTERRVPYHELKNTKVQYEGLIEERFEILKRIELLSDMVREKGYHVDLSAADNTADKISFGIQKKEVQQYTVQVTKYRTESRSRRVRRQLKIGFLKWTYREYTHHYNVQVPYLVDEVRTRIADVPVDVNFSPIDDYLDSEVPEDTWEVLGDDGMKNDLLSTQEKDKIIKTLGQAADAKLTNRQKDYHIFSVVEGELVNQYGHSLEYVASLAENKDIRRRLLLIVPVIEFRADNEVNIAGYKAIHNPLPKRRSHQMPRVELLETYEQTLQEHDSCYVGSLSHTETLFPGEKRNIVIKSSTKYSQQQESKVVEKTRKATTNTQEVQNRVKNEIAQRSLKTKTFSWNVSANGSGSFGAFKAGGSASSGGSSTNTQENSSKHINENINKTMNEISTENELTITTSSSSSLEQANNQEHLVEIQNFNTGRSVTHKFFQVLRGYSGKVCLCDMKIVVSYGDELIPGFGFKRKNLFELSEIDNILPEVIEADRSLFIKDLKEAIQARCETALYNSEIGELDGNKPLTENSWYVNTGSYFIDTEVSPSSAVEKYVEDARRAEIDSVKMNTQLLKSEAEAISNGKMIMPRRVDSFEVKGGSRAAASETE